MDFCSDRGSMQDWNWIYSFVVAVFVVDGQRNYPEKNDNAAVLGAS